MLNEGVEEFVVEGLVPGLAGEHLAEVCAALTHDRLETDHGGPSRYGWGLPRGFPVWQDVPCVTSYSITVKG